MRGRGRDNRPHCGRANLTTSGRGGAAARGALRPPQRTGTVAAIGAFLDLGREINHGNVSTWMRKMKEYVRTNYKSNISFIFGDEGIPGEYPTFAAPADIPNDASFMLTNNWKRASERHEKLQIDLDDHKLQVFGLMLGQMSETSKAKIRETQSGIEAMTEEDPLLLLASIISTHLADPRLGTEQNLLRVRMAYETVHMSPTDTLGYYYQKFKALRVGYDDTMRAAGLLPELTEEQTAQQERITGIKFLNGANASYKKFVEFYEFKLKEWPDTLEEAYIEMTKCTPRSAPVPAYENQPVRANVYVANLNRPPQPQRGKGGRHSGGNNGGRGRGGRTSYGTRPGSCNHCHEPGHFAYECPTNPSRSSHAISSAPSGCVAPTNPSYTSNPKSGN